MPLLREEQPLAETSRQIRLELADRRRVDTLPRARPRSEAFYLRDIARRRDNEAAFARDAGRAPRPPIDRPRAARDHRLRRALALAVPREHPPGQPGRVAAELGIALVQSHFGAALTEFRRGRKADHAPADDGGAHRYSAAFT